MLWSLVGHTPKLLRAALKARGSFISHLKHAEKTLDFVLMGHDGYLKRLLIYADNSKIMGKQ